MKTHVALSAIAAAVAVFSTSVVAQTATTNPTRPEVKADTKASGSLAPPGQGPGASAPKAAGGTMSDTSRSERKETTKAQNQAGALTPPGQGQKPAGAMTKDDKADANMSTRSRADRKAETAAANKAGAVQPPGEAARPISEPPKK